MSYEAKIKEIGLNIPEPAKPVAAYLPSVKIGDYIYTAGQIPFVDGELKFKGKVGKDLSVEQGYKAAKVCALNCLGAIRAHIQSFDQVERIVKVTGFVNSVPDFNQQPKVINGASEILGEIFGEAGAHARSAVGVSNLPMDAAVEVEMIVKVKS